MLNTATEVSASLGERLANAGINTLIGMGSVFIVLILISLIIYCFKFIGKASDGQRSEKEPVNTSVKTPIEKNESGITPELISVIAAAIAAYEGTNEDDFIVRSIRKRERR